MRRRNRDIDAQHLAEEGRRVLGTVPWVVPGTAVAKTEIQESVRAEGEMATIMVAERLRDDTLSIRPLEIETGRGIRAKWIGRRACEPRDDRVAGWIRETDKDAPA